MRQARMHFLRVSTWALGNPPKTRPPRDIHTPSPALNRCRTSVSRTRLRALRAANAIEKWTWKTNCSFYNSKIKRGPKSISIDSRAELTLRQSRNLRQLHRVSFRKKTAVISSVEDEQKSRWVNWNILKNGGIQSLALRRRNAWWYIQNRTCQAT